MSRHSTYRLNLVHQAILVALFGISSVSASAVTLGQANITSAQHEPLSATINVTDIDADNFSASIGDASMYQQMGLSRDTNIQVQFIPTSDTTGQLVLSSNAPISAPFADIVLSINDNGSHVLKPQTLLMPLPKNNVIPNDLNAPAIVASGSEPNLPIISGELVEYGEPLALQNTAPPPLFGDDNANLTANNTPTINNNTDAVVIVHSNEVLSSFTPEGTNTQLDILSEQITRTFYPAGMAPTSPTIPHAEKPNITTQVHEQPVQNTNTDTQDNQSAVYVVQNGDNLWSIANEIAKANNLSLTEVMDALHKQNPDAFNHGKINQLKANATLRIPSYNVIPSQKAIQDAITARQTARRESNARSTPTLNRNTQARRNNATRATPSRTNTTRALPKPQMTLVTPSQGGSATGSQAQNSQARGTSSGGAATNTLQSTRQQTANNARRVNSLNQELSTATQRLQLQNQRLAELEARLKALREQ